MDAASGTHSHQKKTAYKCIEYMAVVSRIDHHVKRHHAPAKSKGDMCLLMQFDMMNLLLFEDC